MSTCIKTGAVIEIEDYWCVGVGDIHMIEGEMEDMIVINFDPKSFNYDSTFPRPLTHRVFVGEGYFHQDKGILVCDRDLLLEA